MVERIGKYEIGRKLGEGATSVVYLGHDPFADRDVAVKLIYPEALKDTEKGRVLRHQLMNEASLAGKLLHPHIAQIYDAVIDPAQSYIVMEYVGGGTLEPFCAADNLLPLERIVEIIFKCSRALDYANRHGITHRDIKPANILLTEPRGGDIKISDFGTALQAADQTLTQVIGIGSPAYMSPQQVQELQIDHRTDIWSLGVVMYQLLTGRLPFLAANNFTMIYRICNAEVPPPSTFRIGIPASVDAIVTRAMQRDLSARYATWEEFSHDLAQAFRSQRLAAQRGEFADSEKFESVRGLPFFAAFSDVEIWEVVRFSRWQAVTPETLVIRDGESGDYFCLLLEGELRVSKRGHTLSVLARGDCFGEMAVIARNGHLRSADVIAQTTAKIVTIPGEALRRASEVCRMHFYEAFLGVLASRLASANVWLASA